GVKVATAPPAPVASKVMLAGHVTVGAVVSWTFTVKVQLPEFPCASLAVQFTVVFPITNVLPLAGAQVTASLPSTTSVEVAVKVATAPAAPVASKVILAGQVTV